MSGLPSVSGNKSHSHLMSDDRVSSSDAFQAQPPPRARRAVANVARADRAPLVPIGARRGAFSTSLKLSAEAVSGLSVLASGAVRSVPEVARPLYEGVVVK